VQNFLQQTLNGVTYAGLLFLLGSGFTLMFGLMRIVNLAHGATYLIGGYVGYTAMRVTRNFGLALLAGGAAGVIRTLRARHLSILLVEQNYRLGVDAADHVHILAKGALVWEGPPGNLEPAEDVKQAHLGI
jgi:branched-chain amino acid transport system permease protein